MAGSRVEFLKPVREAVARKAMYVCSNPTCLRFTGFVTENGKPHSIAQAAHIAPAGSRGPRHDDPVVLPDGTHAHHGHEGNAIWLCAPCHILVDASPHDHPSDMLLEWKTAHEARMLSLTNLDLERALLRLGEVRQYDDVALDLLVWIDGRRFMYHPALTEDPEHVFAGVEQFRAKTAQVSSFALDPGSPLRIAADVIMDAVLRFLDGLQGVKLNPAGLWSVPGDFETFREQLENFRLAVLGAVLPLVDRCDFQFRHVPQQYVDAARDPKWAPPVEFRFNV